MDRKSTRLRQEWFEVEVIPPHGPTTTTQHNNKKSTHAVSTSRKDNHGSIAKKSNRKAKSPESSPTATTIGVESNEQWGIIDNSNYTTSTSESSKKNGEDDRKYCEFCGSLLEEQYGNLLAQRRKYCSPRCRSIATGRRTRARLGVRPTRHEISKLNPLYFN